MNLKENWNRSKEVLGAYLRQGAKELGGALYGPGTAAQPAEYGMAATKLPSEIARDMQSDKDASELRDNTASLDRYTQERPDRGEPAREPERDDRHLDRE